MGKVKSKVVNRGTWMLGGVVTLISLVFCLAFILLSVKTGGLISAVAGQAASIVLATGVFSWWGAYVARMEVKRYVEEGLRVKATLDECGLERIDKWPIRPPDAAKEVDILFIRGKSWLGSHFHELVKMASKSRRIRFCLANPMNGAMVKVMAGKFGESEAETAAAIRSSITSIIDFEKKVRHKKLQVQVWVHGLIPTYTYYRFGDTSHLLLYPMRRGRIPIPVLTLRDGSLTTFLEEDFGRLLEEPETELIFDSSWGEPKALEQLTRIGIGRGVVGGE